jgi:hypothetical protein
MLFVLVLDKLNIMSILSDNYTIFFCGISKNCIDNLPKNLDFLTSFFESSKYNCNAILVDSDSIDGTKKLLNDFSLHKENIIYQDLDGLELKFSNRIERIQISRNKCLDLIKSSENEQKIIYIPLDLDIDLFKYTSVESFEKLIDYCINKDQANGIFPFSTPYYYDIFALRATNWNKINSQYWVKKLKKYFKIGSFVYNYILIFKRQITISKFKLKKPKIYSAFGGIGVYKLDNSMPSYELSKKNPEDVSEHVKFNYKFNELEILPHWNVPAPNEHLEFRLLKLRKKFRYFLKTIFFDLSKDNSNS